MTFAIELLVRGAVLFVLTAMTLGLLRRTAAAYRHLICVLALFAFLVLPLAQWLVPPFLLRTPPIATAPERLPQPTEKPGQLPARKEKPTAPLSPNTIALPHTKVPGASLSLPQHSDRATFFLLAIWGIGTGTLLIRLMVALLRLRRLERESRETMLGEVAIRVSEQVRTPLTWGIRRSVILLPANLLLSDSSVCDSALRHEQAHIARGDWLWNLFGEIVCALFWFQPGAWWLRSRMRLESERACDDRVLLSGITGPDYATHLLEIARTVGAAEVAPAMAQSGGMEERMRHILDPDKPRRAKRVWLAITVPLALGVLSLASVRVAAKPADAPQVGVPPATKSENPGIKLDDVIWGEAVDGLEPGFLLNSPGSLNNVRVPYNSRVDFTVLARNASDRELIFEARFGAENVWIDDPYVIPSDTIWEALRARPLPEQFRARGLTKLVGWPPSYYVKLAPGEAIVLPGKPGLYIGDADKGDYPRIEAIMAGMNWIVQPITVRLLPPAEREEYKTMSAMPHAQKQATTIVSRDGKTRQVFLPQIGAQAGGKQLYAKIQLEMGTLNAAAARNADKAVWGKVEKGMQCGIRLLKPKRAFQVGDTLEAELLWRNTGNTQIHSVLPRTLDLYPSIHDAKGTLCQIDFGGRFNLRPASHTFEPGEIRSLGVTQITLVREGTPSPKSNMEPGHIALSPGVYKLSGFGGVGDPSPESGTIEFQVVDATTGPSNGDGITWGEKARGIQLGARMVSKSSTFKVGDTIKFQAFGRNLSGKDTDLSIGNYWKVNYKIQIQTRDGKPIYMERDALNQAEMVAGYIGGSLGNGETREISEARLKVAPPLLNQGTVTVEEDPWVESVALQPGRYRVRLVSWSVFGADKPEPASGWILIEIKPESS